MSQPDLACIEVGGSGAQTVTFARDGTHAFQHGAVANGTRLGLAVPGIVASGRVVAASNLGWYDVDPAEELHLGRPADIVLNDGEAQALGEAALRGVDELTLVALGTGVGGAVVRGGAVVADNLFGHVTGYSDRTCACGKVGCLETVAAGWALPDPVPDARLQAAAWAVADAIAHTDTTKLVVVAGGLARRHPALVELVGELLPDRTVEPTAAPEGAKSAAAWGLREALG